MASDHPVALVTAADAERACREALTELLEFSCDRCADAHLDFAQLSAVCRDAALLADAIGVLRRRSAP